MSVLRGIASTVMTRYVVLGLIVAGIFLMVITVTCAVNTNSPTSEMAGLAGSADAMETSAEEFVRPACAPVPGWDRDPCERQSSESSESETNSGSHGSYSPPPLPFDPEWLYRSEWGRGGHGTPQLILRGVVAIGSARCSEVRGSNFGDGDHGIASPESPVALVLCFVDVDVSEYVVGTGPARVPMIVSWRSVYRNAEGFGSAAYFDEVAAPYREELEGREYVVELGLPPDMAWGEWRMVHSWLLERRSDGTIVAGAALWVVFRKTTESEDWEYPIDELQRKLKAAHAKIAAEYGGRISDEPDSPMLVTDASRESLLAQLRELGAYDAPGITPAPAPTAEPWDGYE